MHSSEDPLDQFAQELSIEFSQTPLYPALIGQQKWWVDDQVYFGDGFGNIWSETDLQMLVDPEGLSLQAALRRGLAYIPWVPCVTRPIDHHHPIHLLFLLASNTMDEDFHQCIVSRLRILLENNSDPRLVYPVLQNWCPPGKPVSCTGYAIYLGLSKIWEEALKQAEWTSSEIQDLFDEELYLGIPELVDGTLRYHTRDEQRKQFIENLRRDGFANLDHRQLECLSHALQFELGLRSWGIMDMIREVTAILKRRATPGSWQEENTKLIPGKDFELPLCHEKGDDLLKNWKCIREIWDEELGGCIPEGQEDSEDEGS